MREHLDQIVIKHTRTDGNTLAITLTSATTAFVQVEGNRFAYKGHLYYATAHLLFKDGHWTTDVAANCDFNCPDAPHTPGHVRTPTLRSAYGYIRNAMVGETDAFLQGVEPLQHYRAKAQVVASNNEILRVEEDKAELVARLKRINDYLDVEARIEADAKVNIVPDTYVRRDRQ